MYVRNYECIRFDKPITRNATQCETSKRGEQQTSNGGSGGGAQNPTRDEKLCDGINYYF